MIYQFEHYFVDQENRKLLYNDPHNDKSSNKIVTDDSKTVTLLSLLCENYPEVVDKQTLIDALWPDQVVTDWSLSKLVSDVRQLLDDSGKEQGYIKTVRGRGFRLNVAVQILDTAPVTEFTPLKVANVSHSISKPDSYSNGLKVGLTLAFVAIATFALFNFLPLRDSAESFVDSKQGAIRVAVLPITSETDDPIDEWIKFGVMSLATEQLGQYPSIQTIPVATIIATVAGQQKSIDNDELGNHLFDAICGQVGCSHVVSIKYKLVDNQPALSYQIFDEKNRSAISEFIQSDIIDTTDVLLDYLASDIIPGKRERISLADTYSSDHKANRDYATGVNELYSGDISSAKIYLNLALDRQPDFIWAGVYLAEANYRSGALTEAANEIKALEKKTLSDKQSYFLRHLHSNVLYSQGNLSESLAMTKLLLENPLTIEDPLLRGNELLNIGSSLQALGKLDEALDYLNRASKSYQKAKFGSGEGKALYNLGNVYLTQTNLEKALDNYQAAREVFKKFSMQGYALMAKHQVATTSLVMGKYQYAEGELRLLVDSYRAIGDLEGELTAYLDLAIVSIEKNDFQESAIRVERLLEMLKTAEYSYIRDQALSIGVYAYLKLAQLTKAESFYKQLGGEWSDPRPQYALIGAYLLHQQGKLKESVAFAISKKQELGELWSDSHQLVLKQLQHSFETGSKQAIDF